MPKSLEDINYWSSCWRHALANMPRYYRNGTGSPKVLRMLLGYKTGTSLSSAQHVSTAANRGDRPRDPKQQYLLQILAGPNGKTIAKAIAIQRNLDLSRWKYWP